MDDRASVWHAGEDAAARAYADRGYRVLARNWRCNLGELDLVAARGDLLVFCEVKTRRGAAFGGGFEAVHARKRAKVRAVAEVYLAGSGTGPASVRFDVASVAIDRAGSASVELFEDAF